MSYIERGTIRALSTDKQSTVDITADTGSGALSVLLANKIAGEDLSNDVLKVVDQTQQSHSLVFDASISPNVDQASASFDSSVFRRYCIAAYGDSGPMKVKLRISPDNGVTWFWHPNGETLNQYPVQMGDVTNPLCQVVVTNAHTATQHLRAWLTLNK